MIVLPNFVEHLKINSDHFKNLSDKQQRSLEYNIRQSLFGENRHKYLTSASHFGSVSLSSSTLKNTLGNNYTKIIQPYFEEIQHLGSASYKFSQGKRKGQKKGKKKSFTKRFKLQNWVKQIFIEYCNDSEPIDLYKRKSDVARKIKTLPANGICNKDKNGLPKKSKIWINPVVNVNIELLNKRINEIEIHLTKKGISLLERTRYETILYQLLAIKRLLNNTLIPNRLLQIYEEHSSGRLYGNGFHLIYLPKKIRYILFADMELYDYDISNCHFRMFYELAIRNGYDCKSIKYYLDNKKLVRTELSQLTSQFEVRVKKFLISLMYGNKPYPFDERNEMFDYFGKKGLEQLHQNKLVKGLVKEIRAGSKIILENTPKRGSSKGLVLMNVWNKGKHLLEKKKTIKLSQQMSHILTGWESIILDFIYQNANMEFNMLCFDGWISPKIDVGEIVKKIKNDPQLCIDLDIEEEKITPPTLKDLIT